MAARRSSFRFRLPWSQDAPTSSRPNARTAASPAPPPAAGSKPTSQATNTANLSTAETATGNQTSNPTKNTTPRTQNDNQLSNTSTSTSATPEIAGSSAETNALVQPSTNSPTRVTMSQIAASNPSTPKIAQRPPFRPAGAASSPKNRTSRKVSQPSPPPQATSKSRIISQPASPSGAATKSSLSQSPSPSPQSPATSSPSRRGPQVLSTKANKESSNSPSVANSQIQEKNQVNTWPTLPPKSLKETSEPSSKSTEALSPIRDKEPAELQTKSDTISGARIRFRDKAAQLSEETVPKSTTVSGIKEGQPKKSDSSSMTGEPKILKESATSNQETKDVKEVLRGKNYGAGEKSSEVQSRQAVGEDDILINPVSNGRQTRTITSPSRNKTMSRRTAEPDIPIHKEIKDHISNGVAVGNGKQESEKAPVNVITLAGDNRGAAMQLGSDSSTKGGGIHIHRGYPDEGVTDDGEGSSKRKDAKSMEGQTKAAAYINCNVQGINNSIVVKSSISEGDAGVQIRMHSEAAQSRKFEAARIVRRRCLRGLFLESSDSDNPRRHGCRVSCKQR